MKTDVDPAVDAVSLARSLDAMLGVLRGPEAYSGRVLVALVRAQAVSADGIVGVQPETARSYLDTLTAVGLTDAEGVHPHRRYFLNTPGKEAITWLAVVASRRAEAAR
jgi:hypothetical protein